MAAPSDPSMTTYDFMARRFMDPVKMQRMLTEPEGMNDVFHFTPTNEHDVYPYIDVRENKSLMQTGKVVLITGASRGIGRGIACSFARADAKGIVLCARSVEDLHGVQDEIKKLNPQTQVLVQRVDVTSEADVDAAFNKAVETFGTVDVAIHNAGLNKSTANLAETALDSWWSHFEVHCKGLFLVARRFIRNLDGKSGTLINTSSTSAVGALPTQSGYGASKHASDRIIETLTLEYPHLRAFTVHPGVVDTEITRFFKIKESFGWKMDSPDLAGGTALFLTTPAAEFLRGRWVSSSWRMDQLVNMQAEILRGGLLKSGLNAKLGVD